MVITYVNRKKKSFYLHQGLTKKGNPKYYFSQKSDGELVNNIPSGIEIYESPEAQVFLRRVRPKIITDAEVEIVPIGIENYSQTEYNKIDVKDKAIFIYLVDQDISTLSKLFESASGTRGKNVSDIIDEFATYSSMMRFVLADAKRRQFVSERYCFFWGNR